MELKKKERKKEIGWKREKKSEFGAEKGLLQRPSKENRWLWICHLADVLQWAYNEAQGLWEVEFSTLLGLVGSNQFL